MEVKSEKEKEHCSGATGDSAQQNKNNVHINTLGLARQKKIPHRASGAALQHSLIWRSKNSVQHIQLAEVHPCTINKTGSCKQILRERQARKKSARNKCIQHTLS
ncbi:hypothetical protein TRVL_10360 [Trypanosoma vivax]|nr:hypothetical protein TRVL_10360 [Trypanosoma vivax]